MDGEGDGLLPKVVEVPPTGDWVPACAGTTEVGNLGEVDDVALTGAVWHDMPMRVGAFEVLDDGPELKNTIAIANLRPWVDVGRVGTLVLNKLERHMNAVELGRLAKPGVFLDFTRERPKTRVVNGKRVLTKPNTIARYARDEETGRDYLFLHLREPHMFGEDYTDAVVKLLQHYNVVEYCRIGSMWDSVPHTRPLMVTGTLNELYEGRTRHLVSVRRNTYEGPTSIVNLVGDTPHGVQRTADEPDAPHPALRAAGRRPHGRGQDHGSAERDVRLPDRPCRHRERRAAVQGHQPGPSRTTRR